MKKQVFLFLAFLAFTNLAMAQSDNGGKIQTLGGGGNTISLGGYAAGQLKVSSVDGNTGLLLGGYGGVLLSNTVMLGGGAYTLVNDIKAKPGVLSNAPLGNDVFLNLSYGGPMIEVLFMSNDAIHFGLNTMVGFGSASLASSASQSSPGGVQSSGRVVMLEPGLFLETNVTSWFRVGLGASYRYATTSRLNGYTPQNLSGPSADLTLKFGIF